MNFAADHLDRHPSMEAYRNAKLRIFENQTGDDFAVVNGREELPELAARTITFSAYEGGGDFVFEGGKILFGGEPVIDYGKTLLRGGHNVENLMAAMGLAHTRGIAFADMVDAASSYRPPRHRCELVAIVGGHEFINDSKATNLHALESSLRSQPDKVVLILGGKDKGLDFAPLAGVVADRCSHVVAIGELRDHLASALGGHVGLSPADSLEEAVRIAFGRASESRGRTVLFSPGTSSFDMFRGYEERGDVFCESVNRLIKP
jgi:UDP-N-acetylmuramoylalanine--D-glutamate ligase